MFSSSKKTDTQKKVNKYVYFSAYLVKSIENFINQEELIELMKKNKFENCTYKNLSGGIVAIHSGWKI